QQDRHLAAHQGQLPARAAPVPRADRPLLGRLDERAHRSHPPRRARARPLGSPAVHVRPDRGDDGRRRRRPGARDRVGRRHPDGRRRGHPRPHPAIPARGTVRRHERVHAHHLPVERQRERAQPHPRVGADVGRGSGERQLQVPAAAQPAAPVTAVIVEHLSLVDFRNYAEAELELQAGTNLLVGRNGQGKTNLAEAVAYLATLGSHRVSADAPLVREGKSAAFVRARLAHGSRRVMLELQITKQGSNKARVSGNPVRTNELPRYAQVVLFAPAGLTIVRGDPSARRRFADQLLVQRTPRMAAVLADYDRTLRQRTTLLKSARARGMKIEQLTTLEVWDDKLISLGSQIIDARDRLARDLTDPLKTAYAAIAVDDHTPEIPWPT